MRLIWLFCLIIYPVALLAQEPEPESAQWEALAESTGSEPENDELEQQLNYLLRRPLAINMVSEQDLLMLHILTPQQLIAFSQYRRLFGPLRNRYELQAIPGWDIRSIKKILPYISFSETGPESRIFRRIITKGQHQLIIRTSSALEKSKGLTPDSNRNTTYTGNRLRQMYRYTYQYKQQAWWGFTSEKDAGESPGDFNSFHLFIKRAGWLKTIAVGDYTINIGQGLVQWQGLAFGKTSESMAVYRQGNSLQPYRSAGEWNFLRGIATQFQYRQWEATLFVSSRKLSANLSPDTGRTAGFTSISETGYHRTDNELEDRNVLSQAGYGGVLQYVEKRFRAGLSFVNYRYSIAAVPEERPDNVYAVRGRSWYNSGIHYSYTMQNMFFFGEAAACRSGLAIIQGLVMSLHHKVDFSVVYRNIAPGYQAIFARSFTENSAVNNESGLYSALRFAPWPGWQVQAYSDVFRFPWLRFRADAPGVGHEYFLQVGWTKRKKWNSYLRYRAGEKPENLATQYTHEPVPKIQKNLRLHIERVISPQLLVSGRFDKVWFKKGIAQETGYAVYLDGRIQFRKPALVFTARTQYFHTDSYNSRIYAYERDLLYSFSIPAFYDQGFRYYCQVQGKPARYGSRIKIRLQWWLRWSQSLYGEGHTIGSGHDEISGNKKSDWKCQLMLTW